MSALRILRRAATASSLQRRTVEASMARERWRAAMRPRAKPRQWSHTMAAMRCSWPSHHTSVSSSILVLLEISGALPCLASARVSR